MTNVPDMVAPRRQRFRLRFVAIASLIGVLIGAIYTYRHYTNPSRVAALAQGYLQRYTPGRIHVGSARFSWRKGIRLFDVALFDPLAESSSDSESPPVFRCEEVLLAHRASAILLGRLDIESVTAEHPTCTIVRDRHSGRTNLEHLLALPSNQEHLATADLPTVELRGARVVVVSKEREQDRVVEDLTLSVRAMPSPQAPAVVDVVWQGGHDPTAGGHSQIDLRTGLVRNVRGGLPWMSIEAVMLAVNAHYDGAGAWCDLLGLGGNVRASEYRLDGSVDDPDRSATVELRNATLSIPLNQEEAALPSGSRYLRFEEVHGEAELSPDGIRAVFDGRFHGSECHVVFHLRGGVERWSTLEDVDFEAGLQVMGLRVPRPHRADRPDEDRFIHYWGRLADIYRDYDPDGLVDVECDVSKRAGKDQPITVKHALVTARGGTSTCRFFPYTFHEVTGRIEYTPEDLRIVDLHGVRGGGEATVNAWLDAPTLAAEKHVDVTARGIEVDGALLAALPSRFRAVAADFHPGGQVDAQVTLRQPEVPRGTRPKWTTATTISLRGVRMQYDRFPYPLENLTGTLTVDGDRLTLQNITGQAEGGRISADGAVHFERDSVSHVSLKLRAESTPLDGKLLEALPASFRKPLQELQVRGTIDVDADLLLDPSLPGNVRYQATVTVRDGAVKPAPFPVEISEVGGDLELKPGYVGIRKLTGRYGKADLTAQGSIQMDSDPPSVELTIASKGLLLDEAFRKALPADLRTSLGEWRLNGPIDTQTVFRRGHTDDEADLVTTDVSLRRVRVTHPRLGAPWEEVEGRLRLDSAGLSVEGMDGRWGTAMVHGEGQWLRQGEQQAGEWKLSAIGLTLDKSVRHWLPPAAAALWDKLNPSGQVDVFLDQLHVPATTDGAPAPIQVKGYVELRDVALRGPTTPLRLSGSLSGTGSISEGSAGTSLDGRAVLSTLEWGMHRFHSLSAEWSLARMQRGEGVLTFPSVTGQLYGGSLSGKIDLQFDDGAASFDASAMIRGMQLQPFIITERAARKDTEPAPDVRGTVNADVYVSGPVGDVTPRRGGGRIEIVDGHLYRLPILLAILNVLNLSMPQDDALAEARAEFFLVGDRLQFQEIVLRGDSLALTGSGTMTLTDRAVDWHLVNVGTKTWARIPVLAEFMEGASRELVEVRVTGPLSQPQVRARSFGALRDEFNRLFQKRKPRTVAPSSGS